MTRILVLSLALTLPLGVPAQGEVKPELVKIKDGIYMLKAQGGNIGLSIGKDGVFMIDDQFAPLTPALLATIRTVTDQPVKFVVNTHWHGDHTGGNENLGKEGAIIIAHDNVYERMSTDQLRVLSGNTTPASPGLALPVVTFNRRATFHMNGHTITALHSEHAHTDGDSIIFFKEANVVHMGDVFFQAGYPFVDVETGGSIDGTINAVDHVLNRIDAKTVIIPGHGVLSNKQDLREYREVLVTIRNRIQKLIDQDKTLQEIQAEKPTEEFDARWGTFFITGDKIVELIYLSLTDARFDFH